MKKRTAALLLCALLLFQMTVVPACAEEPVYFVAADNEVQPLSDQTMPFWYRGYLYIPANIFTGTMRKVLGVTFQYVESEQVGILSRNGQQFLLFDLKKEYAVDSNGQVSYPGGLRRNGIVYVPAFLIAKYFDLEYSVTDVSHGYLVWIRQKDFGLTDKEFANAASFQMDASYAEYSKSQEQEPALPDEGPDSPDVEIEGKSVYLCFQAGVNTATVLDVLDYYHAQAAFFCTPEFLGQQGGLLRRMTATGQSIGILLDAADTSQTLEEQLEAGNRALAQATCGKTRLVLLQNGGQQEEQLVRDLGYSCLQPGVDRTGYELKTSSNATSLLQRVSSQWGDVTVWLADTVSATGLGAFLYAIENGDGRCFALTETA